MFTKSFENVHRQPILKILLTFIFQLVTHHRPTFKAIVKMDSLTAEFKLLLKLAQASCIAVGWTGNDVSSFCHYFLFFCETVSECPRCYQAGIQLCDFNFTQDGVLKKSLGWTLQLYIHLYKLYFYLEDLYTFPDARLWFVFGHRDHLK